MNWKQLQGQIIDREFQLVEHLGGTDTSATFLAAAPDGVKAAVKLVVASTNQELPASWKISESLSHPHLLRVFRIGTSRIGEADFLFLVMEYAEENLSQVLPQRALASDEVREMLPPVLDALQYLHGEQLVHGNLKPGNIMAAGDQLKLSSDDVLRFADPLLTSSPYSAPEASHGVNPSSDLWSLGVTLTEVLTQRRPTWEPGSTLAQLPDNMPEQFRVIVQRCLIPDPALRGTIADVREKLKPPALPTPPPPKPIAQKRSPLRFALLAGIAAVAIGAFVSISHNTDAPQNPATPATETATSSQAAPPFQSPPPAVLTEATDPKPTPEPQKTEPDKPQKLEVLMSPKTAANAAPPPPKPQTVTPSAKAIVSGTDAVVQRVIPDVPQKAMRTINGKFRVMVKVHVNQDGDVVGSEFASRGPSKYFADLTMQAAKQWKFNRGETSERAWNLEFEFRRSGITANPTRIDR